MEEKKELIPEIIIAASPGLIAILQEVILTVIGWCTWKWMTWIWYKFSGTKKDPEDKV